MGIIGELERDTGAASLDDRLVKSRKYFFSGLRKVFSSRKSLSAHELFPALEELLISSDCGVKATRDLLSELKSENSIDLSEDGLLAALREKILKVFADSAESSSMGKEIASAASAGTPNVVLVVGVNGAGKTTTIGKLAQRLKGQGAVVALAACDTFRAAAPEQLRAWGERAGVKVVSGVEGAKPSTVAYEAVHYAKNEAVDVLFVDTAGRLHNRSNLMNELENVKRIIERECPGAPQEILLVVDGSSGQNALEQARVFHEAVKLSGVIITKLDGTPKGGIVIAICKELGIPVRYIGVGEGAEDLRPFISSAFVDALFAEHDDDLSISEEGSQTLSAHAAVRRRRRN
ncbi:MAG: signal recognition particle-docking protein FtsY [bacterium]|nr:signal recognition particle-docking protein FtsY [bacterium]